MKAAHKHPAEHANAKRKKTNVVASAVSAETRIASKRSDSARDTVARTIQRMSLPLLIFLVAAPGFAAVPVSCWDLASEFNDSKKQDAANPSGVWSYGWKKNLTGRFFLATTPFNDPPSRFGWCSASGGPAIVRNVRPVTVTVGVNPLALGAGALDLAPALNGEYAVVRFTAPSEGSYKVSGQFYAQDDNDIGTTTDVWILPNDTKTGAFSGKVDYPGGAPVASFTSVQFQLKKGDTLDFEVGYGANKDFFYDNTGLNALIEKIK